MKPFSFLCKKNLIKSFFSFLKSLPFSDRIFLQLALMFFLASSLWLLVTLNNNFAEEVAVPGGTVVEGVLGTPRFANPILATTRADNDVNALVYEGVMHYNQDGELVPNLAEKVTLSEDGTTYTITLRKDVRFHDGTPLTADDVVFTYERIKNSETKSPLRGNWNRASIEKTNDYTLKITLPEAYIPFIENLTVGILPSHIWESVAPRDMTYSVHNTKPVGSGPFMINTVDRTDHGSVKGYKFIANPFASQKPYLDSLTLKFYPTLAELQTALENKQITSTVDIPLEQLKDYSADDFKIHSIPLPQVFAIFFNQNRNAVLRQNIVREALNLSVDREALIKETLYGYGLPTDNTIPTKTNTIQSTASTSSTGLAEAKELLRDNGWQRNDDGIWQHSTDDETLTLSLTIQTVNDPTLSRVTEAVAQQWRDLGAEVKVEQYEQSDLVNSIIRPRTFDAVLFGIEIGRQIDLYPFWHSSQQTDPGLNIAQYTNISVDEKLEAIRKETDTEEIEKLRKEIVSILQKEVPAVFLYTPTINYITLDDLNIGPIHSIKGPQDRLQQAMQWHTHTDTLWPLFHKNYAIQNYTNNENYQLE